MKLAGPLEPTPYADVNSLLRTLLENMQALLGERLVGLYLRGSLSQGDFDPPSSDIDFLAVTDDDLPEAQFDQLREMHAAIASSGHPYAQRLEGSYIPRAAIRRYDPSSTARHPTIGVDWPFKVDVHGSDWVFQRAIVQTQGVIVWGPPPQTLIDPVSPQDLRDAVCDQLNIWWWSRLDAPDWMRPRDYQAYTVLTMCRAFYTLEQGTLCSKPQAAAWAQAAYPHWKPSIERALAWRADHAPDDVTETMAFLREALVLAQERCR